MSDQKGRLEAIFHIAKELADAEERDIYLREVCQGDPQMRSRLERLLGAADDAESLFAEAETSLEAQSSLMAEVPLSEGPGTRIGRYKLLQKIGEGGMGVVYMAEQVEPVNRQVALKIIKLGMDTKQVVARFEAERQALALMDHPNIAKVLDAGATDSGRPYFVMELVRGAPITEYCDKNRMGIKERLELFVPICQAIQHAHQKGILHRDIKPSNVLVTLHDGQPVAKVIDFGIAKATNQKLTEKTLFTHYSQMIGTPAYMSPEQAEMSGLDVDTRTDVYSLGVMLYELLTGTTPFRTQELLSAGYGEMRRIISESEPPKPSARLSTVEGKERTVVSKNRRIEFGALTKEIEGDLDWIIMKALEKDRTRRYETVNGLAEDVRRHLNEEPVSAVAPTLSYQMSKLYRRHKGIIRAAAAVMALLGVSTAVSGWLAVKATRAEKKANDAVIAAQVQTSLAQAVNDFLNNDILGQANPWIQPVKDITLIEVLDQAADSVGRRFQDQPLVEAGVRLAVGKAYFSLQEFESARTNLTRALEIRRRELGDNVLPTMEVELCFIDNLSVGRLMDPSLSETYEAMQPRMIEMYENVLEIGDMSGLLERQFELSAMGAMRILGKLQRAESVWGRAYSRALEIAPTDRIHEIAYLWRLARHSGDSEKVGNLLRLALRLAEDEFGPNSDHLIKVSIEDRLWRLEEDTSRTSLLQFSDIHSRLVASYGRHYGEHAMTTLRETGNYANTLERLGLFEEAMVLTENVAASLLEKYGMANDRSRWIHRNLANRYALRGRYEEALAVLRRLEEVDIPRRSDALPTTSYSQLTLWRRLGSFDHMVAHLEEVADELTKWRETSHLEEIGQRIETSDYILIDCLRELLLAYSSAGNGGAFASLLDRATTVATEIMGRHPPTEQSHWELKRDFMALTEGSAAALAVSRESSETLPENEDLWFYRALFEAVHGHASEFALCIHWIREGEKYAASRERVLKLCLMWPELNPLTNTILETTYLELEENLAQQSVLSPSSWGEVTLAIYDYREGRYQEAIDRVERAERVSATFQFHFEGGLAKGLLIKAMSEYQLARSEDARRTYFRAREFMDGFYPPSGEGPPWGHNLAVVFYDKMLDEATALLGLEED